MPPRLPVSSIDLMSPRPQPRTLGSRWVLVTIQSKIFWAFSTSVRAPSMAFSAVSQTMPSVGNNLVGWVQYWRLTLSSRAVVRCFQSCARLWVCTRLVSSTKGCAWSAANSTYSIRAPYLLSLTRSALPLVEKLFSRDCCQSEFTEGIGSHTRLAPWGWAMSTRVVTSNVRQVPGAGVNWRWAGVAAGAADTTTSAAKLIAGSAVLEMATAEFFKKLRRAACCADAGTVVIQRTPDRWISAVHAGKDARKLALHRR